MRKLARVATAFDRRRKGDRQPLGYYGKLRDWQIAEIEDDQDGYWPTSKQTTAHPHQS